MSHRGFRARLAVVALPALAVLLTACATVPGTPVAGEIDVRTLTVGSYPTDPADYRREFIHSLTNGVELAVMRLAGAVAGGIEVDPAMRYTARVNAITSVSNAGAVLADSSVAVAEKYRMRFGYSVAAATDKVIAPGILGAVSVLDPFGRSVLPPDASGFSITVLQFPDAESAGKAATEIDAADFAVAPDLNQQVTLEKYPEAKAHWRPGISSLGVTMARGSYVMNIYVERPAPDLDALRAMATRVIEVQAPLLDALKPLTPREILHLDYDPEGMLRRTLHPEKYLMPRLAAENWLAVRGFLNDSGDQTEWKELTDIGGVDYTSQVNDGALVLRARDADAAIALSEAMRGKPAKPAAASAELPGSWCNEDEGKTRSVFYCTVRYDRYVARVSSNQLPDAHQRAAAQYALLANAKVYA